MIKTQNSKQTEWSWAINAVIGIFRLLEFRIWILFGIWVFMSVFREANYYFLSQLEFTLTLL